MKGYKVFNSDWSCRGKQYSCPGIFEQKGELKICENGIHFCKELIDCFHYYLFNPKNKVAEVEAIGEIARDKLENKYCTSKIKIIRELSWYEVLNLVNIGNYNTGLSNSGDNNSGDYNTGSCNSGYCNSGNYNTGKHNSGNYNSGNYNSGDFNTGDDNIGDYNTSHGNSGNRNTGCCNSGNYNTGSYNSGDCNFGRSNFGSYNTGNCNYGDYNTGSRNSGNCNSGDCNSGDYNSGNCNSGDCNSGDYNTGSHNAGDYNTSDGNFGCFNTDKNKMIFFNKQSNWTYEDWIKSNARKALNKIMKSTGHLNWVLDDKMTKEEKYEYPEYKITKGYLKQRGKEELNSLRQELWEDILSKEEKESILNLPNFDANIFKEITGINITC